MKTTATGDRIKLGKKRNVIRLNQNYFQYSE